ncbi:MAG: NADPH:quinone reductase [Woeseiaceae bacterium]|nr:NADPH:quinone reductase [Woeseiaceae bacterium]
MKAAWYERLGPASDVLQIGNHPTPEAGAGEVRIRVRASGVNPGDVKKRSDQFGTGMAFPRIIPHSDGAGVIDQVGEGVEASRVGERVWCFGAQSYRPFGTAAEYVVVPANQAIELPGSVSYEQGSCLGIPGITAHRAVHVAGAVADRTILIQGGAGAVGRCAVGLARLAGAKVIATVRADHDTDIALAAGAHHVVVTKDLAPANVIEAIQALAPDGIDHIVEVAFHANIEIDEQLLKLGGSIATYATGSPMPTIPFWPLVFKNIRLYFLGSDDFPLDAKLLAARALNSALESDWPGYDIDALVPLDAIAEAHEMIEERKVAGRIIVTPGE